MRVTPRKTIKGAVSQGARILDHYRPGWEKTVKDAMVNGDFEMGEWEHCVAGTVEVYREKDPETGEFNPFISFNGLRFPSDDPRAEYVGFDVGYQIGGDFDQLEAAWRAEIDKRMEGN